VATLDACQVPTSSGRAGSAFFHLYPSGWSGNVELHYKIYHDAPGTTNKLTINYGAAGTKGSPIVTRSIPYGNTAVQGIMYISRDQWEKLASGNLYVNLADGSGNDLLRGQIFCSGSCSKPPAASTVNACSPGYDVLSIYSDVKFPSTIQSTNWTGAGNPYPTVNSNYQDDKLCGSSSMKIGLQGNFYGASWWARNADLVLDSKYQSLEFFMKVAPGYGEYSLAVSTNDDKGAAGSAQTTRLNVDNFIIDENTWTRVLIPLSQLGLGKASQKLKVIGFQTSMYPAKYTEFLIDEWRFSTAVAESKGSAQINVPTFKPLCKASVDGGSTELDGRVIGQATAVHYSVLIISIILFMMM